MLAAYGGGHSYQVSGEERAVQSTAKSVKLELTLRAVLIEVMRVDVF